MQDIHSKIPAQPLQLPNIAVVIPSNREIRLDFLEGIPEDIPIYVVDDSNGSIVANRSNMKVFYYTDQEYMLGPRTNLVPRRSAACRNFAYYYIWKETDHTHVITLDDDCKTHPKFIDQHSVVGTHREWKTYTSPTGWLNSIDLLPVTPPLFARGYPYWARETRPQYQITKKRGLSVCNLGLWENHLDFDGMDKYIVDRYQQTFNYASTEVECVRVSSPHMPTFVPFSGMNVAFIRPLLPVMSQVPMNQQVGFDYSLWRFDDLWSGIIAQVLIDKSDDDCLTVGAPIITHTRVGNLKREVAGEHYGHLISPYLHEIVQEAAQQIHHSAYNEMYIGLCSISYELTVRKRESGTIPKLYAQILSSIFNQLARWSELFL